MDRTFFLTKHICLGESGGGHGVEFRLHQAELKYGLFKREVIYVFGDRVIVGNTPINNFIETKDVKDKSEFRKSIRRFIPSFMRIWKSKKKNNDVVRYLEHLNTEFHFSDEDIFIFHDAHIANAFLRRFSFKNTAMVYHGQGSLYNEWCAQTGLKSELMRNYYNDILGKIIRKTKYLCFPSRGTEESLIASEPDLEENIKKANKVYLYNGVYCPDVNKEDIPGWIKDIDKFDGFKFITVACLNAAKAVERIPQYIGELKKAGISIKWILIGKGIQAEKVQNEINKNNIGDDVIWKRENILHAELMQLFSVTDFYILFHQYSIFDISTLEAMHYGNIPILTPVGGNKEVIIDNNGLFVSDFKDILPFTELLNHNVLEELAEKNKTIQREYFDEKAFLQRYVDLCNGIKQSIALE